MICVVVTNVLLGVSSSWRRDALDVQDIEVEFILQRYYSYIRSRQHGYLYNAHSKYNGCFCPKVELTCFWLWMIKAVWDFLECMTAQASDLTFLCQVFPWWQLYLDCISEHVKCPKNQIQPMFSSKYCLTWCADVIYSYLQYIRRRLFFFFLQHFA
jgi:hypothetical protein